MSKYFNEKISTYNRIEAVLAEYEGVFSSFVPLADLVTEFGDLLVLMRGHMQVCLAAKGKLCGRKEEKFDLMAKLCVRQARKALVWAKKTGVPDAVLVYDVVVSDFKSSGVNSLSVAGNVLDRLRIDLAFLQDYRILEADVDALEAAIGEAQAFISEPATKRKRGAEAKRCIGDLIRKTDGLLGDMEDLIVADFEETDILFVRLFLGARRITDLGSRKTKVLVHVTDGDDKPIGDACAELLEVAGVEHFSDGDGDLTILGIKRGNYTLVVGKGALRARMRFGIMTGEQLRLKVVLVDSG